MTPLDYSDLEWGWNFNEQREEDMVEIQGQYLR